MPYSFIVCLYVTLLIQNCGPKPITIAKLWEMFSKLYNLRSTTSGMVVAIFEFPKVGKVPQTPCYSFLKIGKLLEAVDLGSNSHNLAPPKYPIVEIDHNPMVPVDLGV